MEKATGTVARLTKLGESSWIVSWCTAGQGWIKTVAKGARAPRSKFAGQLDIFFEAEIEWVRARRGELHSLREVSLVTPRDGLRGNWVSTLAAGYFVRLLERAVEPDHPVPELHDLLVRALDHVAEAGASFRAVTYFEAELARLLGVGGERRAAATALDEVLGGLPGIRDELLRNLED